MKLANFKIIGRRIEADLVTAYFSCKVSLDRSSSTKKKWKFGVKSLNQSYKKSIKDILIQVLDTSVIPAKKDGTPKLVLVRKCLAS